MRRLWIAAGLLGVGRLAPEIGRHGMFFDGLNYASLSRNLAIGQGTAWAPRLTETVGNPFYEHPPLFFWVQSVAFRFGRGEWVEKGFGLVCLVLAFALLLRLVRRLLPSGEGSLLLASALATLPWLLSGQIAWLFSNNMLEVLLTPVTLAAVLAFLAQAQASTRRAGWRSGALGVLLVFAALLTKGLPALFPLAVPFLHALVYPRPGWARGLLRSGLAAVAVAVLLGLLLLASAPARAFLERYWAQQVTTTLGGARGGGSFAQSLLAVFRQLFHAIWPSLLPFFVAFALRDDRRAADRPLLRPAAFLALVGLAASLPLAVTPILRGHYLAPSTPYYAGALAFLAVGLLPRSATISPRAARLGLVTAALAAGFGLLVLFHDGLHPVRDPASHEVLALFEREGIQDRRLETAPGFRDDWTLWAYLERHRRVSIEPTPTPRGDLYLVRLPGYVDPDLLAAAAPPGYTLGPADCTLRYGLARRTGAR